MNPELWILAGDGALSDLLSAFAETEGISTRRFKNISESLNIDEPEGGILLAVEADGAYKNYLPAIKRFQKNFVNLEVMVFGGIVEQAKAERDREEGVDLYFTLPLDREDFYLRASHLSSVRRIKNSAGIVGRSRALMEVLDTVMQVAPTEVSVLIEGESGSGKELIARAIHLRSNRRGNGFEAVNCGAMAEGVLESELFGHEKGSFTGAVARRRGLFERADKGTLFLDEVGEMSLRMQVRFLRVLESGEYIRVGGIESLKTDVRVIAATNRELETAVDRGEFRKDLYYRLKVVKVRIPPLRARKEDIPFLIRHFLRASSKKHGKLIRGMEKPGMEMLEKYPWPGNIRELANMIDNLVVLSRDSMIRSEEIEKRLSEQASDHSFPDLPVHVRKSKEEIERELIINSLLSLHSDVREILKLIRDECTLTSGQGGKWRKWVEVEEVGKDAPIEIGELEREAIKEALAVNGGNRKKTARQLGLSERTLYRRLKEYGLG